MKILFISHHVKSRSFLRIINLAQHAQSRGHEITIMCMRDAGRFGIRQYDECGVHYVEVPDLLPARLRTGWDPWDALNRWQYLRKNFDFDLVHAFETRPTTIYPLLRVLRGKKTPLVVDWIDWWGRGGLITTNRPKWYPFFFSGLETFYEENYRTLADATTVICSALGKRAEGLGVRPESIFQFVIGADTESIPFVKPGTHRAQFGLNDSDQVALFSALMGMMDVEMVFDAAVEMKESHPHFKLLMTGNHAEKFTRYAQDKGLGDLFVHLGMLPQDDYVKALTCADVFLLPFADTTYNRGRWPCKIRDYLAAGRPIVSNPVGDVRSIMQKNEVGVLTEFDSDSFAKGIRKIFSDPVRSGQMQKTARRVAETDLNWEKIIDDLEAAYSYAMSQPRLMRDIPRKQRYALPQKNGTEKSSLRIFPV